MQRVPGPKNAVGRYGSAHGGRRCVVLSTTGARGGAPAGGRARAGRPKCSARAAAPFSLEYTNVPNADRDRHRRAQYLRTGLRTTSGAVYELTCGSF
ncbi:hypothetical protein EVAR_8123_1 [Eumeta japonica]|uniref:Uncharacterized protein n=1 Tax=Eumeta variegata TaxID=151549 RepID=A0A4C1TSR4_EUMVA|nr:hypothetical protein EVAR_8123_1 [Eumeta japonica]